MQHVLYKALVQITEADMTEFFTDLIEKSGFDEALIRHALEFSKNIDTDDFSCLFFDKDCYIVENTGVLYFEEAFYPYEFFEKLKSLPLVPENASVYIYILLLERSFHDFCSRIKDTNIFFDTAKKVSESAKEYYTDNGTYGLYDYHFIANHVRGSILRIGGFEYQLGAFEGDKCILLHLPEQADLSRENRLLSYRLARRCFGNLPIMADSWLLFPEHKKMLSEDSRIVDFMNDFDIISTHETCNYSELFHIFGRLSDFSYENLPKETSLQRAYAERVKNGMSIGSGIGKLKY